MSNADLTSKLLEESAYGPGEFTRLVASAKGAATITPGSPVEATLRALRARSDRTMGFISKPLAYSHAVRIGKREHANLIRLIKGGHVHVREVWGKPPAGSNAAREAPFGDRYYELEIGPW